MGSTRRGYTEEYKAHAVAFVINDGRPIVEVARNIGVHEITLGKWVKKARESSDSANTPLNDSERAELERLRAENTELKMQVEFAKSSDLVRERQAVKFAAIADWADSDDFPVEFRCRELGVSRSGYYAWRGRAPSQREQDDAGLLAVIKQVHQRLRGNPGVRRVHAELVTLGHRVAPKRVWRLMKAAGLHGRHPKPWKRTTIAGDSPVPAPDLIGRDFTAQAANQRWCGDITYVKTWEGWAYLATVIDLHSRAVVGWAIAEHLRTELVTAALDMAIMRRRPPAGVVFHSDRGCQYTSTVFAEYCAKNGIRRSLGRTGICYDNAVSESFFATYKKELIHTRPWPNVKYLERETFDWIETYYNTERRHSTLGYLTPREYELGYREISQIAA